jgi:hypothetical protein
MGVSFLFFLGSLLVIRNSLSCLTFWDGSLPVRVYSHLSKKKRPLSLNEKMDASCPEKK